MDEGQLQKVYGFEQGSIWDFFLHALKIKKIPTPKERIENGFESYIKTYDFNDNQIKILRDLKDIVSENIIEKESLLLKRYLITQFTTESLEQIIKKLMRYLKINYLMFLKNYRQILKYKKYGKINCALCG